MSMMGNWLDETDIDRLWRMHESLALLSSLTEGVCQSASITADGLSAVASYIHEDLGLLLANKPITPQQDVIAASIPVPSFDEVFAASEESFEDLYEPVPPGIDVRRRTKHGQRKGGRS